MVVFRPGCVFAEGANITHDAVPAQHILLVFREG